MYLKDSLVPPRAPYLGLRGVPNDLGEVALSIGNNLRAMESTALDAAHALALFDLCTSQLVIFRQEVEQRAQHTPVEDVPPLDFETPDCD